MPVGSWENIIPPAGFAGGMQAPVLMSHCSIPGHDAQSASALQFVGHGTPVQFVQDPRITKELKSSKNYTKKILPPGGFLEPGGMQPPVLMSHSSIPGHEAQSAMATQLVGHGTPVEFIQ